MGSDRLVIGTRGSALALWQSHFVKTELERRFTGLTVELTVIKTLGDKILDAPLSKIGDKGLFTKELESALLEGRADLAVHSLKDVPTHLPDGLVLGAIGQREDVRDVFIGRPGSSAIRFDTLPAGAMVATGSLRRRCQLLASRADLRIVDIRGNLNTRMRKLEESNWSGMILAKAGVVRLGWERWITDVLPLELMLPAVGQGALGIETRGGDDRVAAFVGSLNHPETADATNAERAFLRRLEGGCQVPIGTYGRIEEGRIILDAVIGSLDGRFVFRGRASGDRNASEQVGIGLAVELLEKGADRILDEIRNSSSS